MNQPTNGSSGVFSKRDLFSVTRPAAIQ